MELGLGFGVRKEAGSGTGERGHGSPVADWSGGVGVALGAGEWPGGLYNAASPTLMPTAEITRGGDPTAAASPTPCLMRARPFSRAVEGSRWRTRGGVNSPF